MTCAILSIGSNIGDRLAQLRGVVQHLVGGELADLAVSAVYQSAPWGGIVQEPFLNAVIAVSHPGADENDWLRIAHECEERAQRTREVRWGPRTLDVDIVAVYDESGTMILSEDPRLTLPHPRAHERAFVLAPWLDVDPDASLPQGRVADLLSDLRQGNAPEQAIERTALTLR